MKQFPASLVLLLVLSLPIACAAQVPLTSLVANSLVRVTGTGPSGRVEDTWKCSGFTIATHRFLTAAHCLHKLESALIKVDGVVAYLLAEDTYADLALLEADLDRIPLTLSDTPSKRGDQVMGAGFARGLFFPIFTTHAVEATWRSISNDAAPGTFYINPFLGGMSGGPVVDGRGYVVGMIQRSSPVLGYGVPGPTIIEFLLKHLLTERL